jgi:hypothetical protein
VVPTDDAASRLLADARSSRREREASYRGQALKLFPPICARCTREFQGKRLRELTVHHKDGNHENNPPDGSNWELLCIYCHEEEHGSTSAFAQRDAPREARDTTPHLTHKPFANLMELLGTPPSGCPRKKKDT